MSKKSAVKDLGVCIEFGLHAELIPLASSADGIPFITYRGQPVKLDKWCDRQEIYTKAWFFGVTKANVRNKVNLHLVSDNQIAN